MSCQLLSSSPIGQAVFSHLKSLDAHLDYRDIRSGVDISALPLSQISILVLDHPEPDLCNAMDILAHERNTVFLPLAIQGSKLRVGPAILPGKGACWHCWQMREEQHGLSAPVNTQQGAELPGPYPELIAWLAASRLAYLLHRIAHGEAVGGTLSEIDSLSTTIKESIVVGIHNCPRCGLHRSLDTMSSGELRRLCLDLWATSAETVCAEPI